MFYRYLGENCFSADFAYAKESAFEKFSVEKSFTGDVAQLPMR